MVFPRTEIAIVVGLLALPMVDSGGTSACTADQVSFNWVLLDNMYYWIGRTTTNFTTATCVCTAQQSGVRLAQFNSTVSREVLAYLASNHPSSLFWVDGKRESGVFKWPMGCAVPLDTELWVSEEPLDEDTHLQLMTEGGQTLLSGYINSSPGVPLCQSATPPASYLPLPLTLEWMTFVGDKSNSTFGLSDTKKSLAESRTACDREPGLMHLANLDTQFKEVKQYIFDHHDSRSYWVDATKSPGVFQWGNKAVVDIGVWADGEPGSNDVAARLDMKENDIRLEGRSNPSDSEYFVCQGVAETSGALIEWITLGSSMFGFSMTPSQGFEWAQEACDKEAGDVQLASLSTMFTEVAQYITDKYPKRQYWVYAIGSLALGFRWANGTLVNLSIWGYDEPSLLDDVAYVDLTAAAAVRLFGTSNHSLPLYFICSGVPATTQLPSLPVYDTCTVANPQVITAAAVASPTVATTGASQTNAPMPSVTTVAPPTAASTGALQSTGATSTTPLPTTKNTPQVTPDCICDCRPVPPPRNVSRAILLEEVLQEAKKVQEELIMDKSNLSATIRKKTSAQDRRKSAAATGALGIVMLAVVFGGIILPDVFHLSHFAYKTVKGLIQHGKVNNVEHLDDDCDDGREQERGEDKAETVTLENQGIA